MKDQEELPFPSFWVLVTRILARHWGKVVGSVLGLVVALMIMRVGIWWTAFSALCVYIGYRLGKQMDDQKESFFAIIEKYLPPGGAR